MERVIYNPIFSDTINFIKTAVETKGEVSEMEVTLGVGPDVGTPPHRHTAFDEVFTAIDGELGVEANGENHILKPGETFTVHIGEVHRFFNPTNKPIKFHLEFRPGHTGMENMLRIMYGLARDGKTNKKGIPKSLVTIAIIGEMGNSMLTGFLTVISPLLKLIAVYGRKKGVEKRLLEKYCS